MRQFKVIIAGSRTFNDYELLKNKVDRILSSINYDITIISGTANGADKLGEKYALENNYKIEKYPADWDNLGKKAGYIRNEKMANVSDALIAFWDGHSKGTKHMIDLSKKKKLLLRVIYF